MNDTPTDASSSRHPDVDLLADQLASEVRASADLDRDHDLGDALDLAIDDAVRRHRPLSDDAERRRLSTAVRARLGGLDRLEPLLDDPTIDEVLVASGQLWAERHGQIRHVGPVDADTTRRIIERVVAPLGRRLDRTNPIVDARLPDGSRVCAVVEPIAVDGPTLSIRRFAGHVRPLSDFAEPGRDATSGHVDQCRALISGRCNLLVSGATSSGKTSLLGSLLSLAEPDERIVLLEDTAELPCAAAHLVRLEARPATPEGPAAIDLAQLVRTALRLRPDRLVVGEVRGDEVLALLHAMNTGHDGSIATCHANSAADALMRMEALVLSAASTWPLAAARRHIARSIDAIIHVERRGARREIVEIAEVDPPDPEGGPLTTRPLPPGSSCIRLRR